MGNKMQNPPDGVLIPITRKRLWAKALAAFTLYLGMSPLFLLPGSYLAPDALLTALLLPAAALALTFLAGLLPGRHRKRVFALSVLLQVVICAALLFPRLPMALLLILPCLAAMLLFMPAMARPSGLEWSGQQLFLGGITHVIGQIVKGRPEFMSVGSIMSLFFCAYMLLCLFALNRYALMDGSGEKQSPPAKLLSQNRALVALLGLAALLLSGWRMLKDAAIFLWHLLMKGIAAVIQFIMQLFPALTPINNTGGGQGLDLGGMIEQQPPSLLAVILEKLMILVGVLLSLACLCFLLYRAGKLIKKVVQSILDRFRAYAKFIGEGYVDKTENLFDIGQISKAVLKKWNAAAKRLQRMPSIDKLPPREKVRRIYALMQKRMPELPDSQTAREALNNSALHLTPEQKEGIAAIYEQARYSTRPITADQAATMQKSAGL